MQNGGLFKEKVQGTRARHKNKRQNEGWDTVDDDHRDLCGLDENWLASAGFQISIASVNANLLHVIVRLLAFVTRP